MEKIERTYYDDALEDALKKHGGGPLSTHLPRKIVEAAARISPDLTRSRQEYGYPAQDGAIRIFTSSAEAIAFQDEVKSKILPKLKELLTKHQRPFSGETELLEF
jgi:hypothetical protein